MPDTDFDALTEVLASGLVRTDLLAVETDPAGTPVTKKLSIGEHKAWMWKKGSNVASAGTTTLGDGYLFHITGTTTITDIDFTNSWDGRMAVLIFDGILTLTHSATLQLPGEANIKTAAGDRVLIVVDSGDTVIVVDHIPATGTEEFWIRQAAARNLTSTTTEQKLFDSVSNGRLTIPTGVYRFDCLISLSAMSATSGNFAFDILGAGTAVLADVLYHAVGIDGNTATAAAQTGSTAVQGQSPASIITAGTGTAAQVRITGTFEVTTAGTIIPSVSLVTAAAAAVAAGTYFSAWRQGAINAVSAGPWD